MFWLLLVAIIKPIPRMYEERNNAAAVLVRNVEPYNVLRKVRFNKRNVYGYS
jgi:hypothetical protein